MKTKDFIKMLQEADPKGEGYIRFPWGGAPWCAEVKEGYWDGSYQYIKKINPDKKNYIDNLKIVTSTKGYKVDLHCLQYDDIIWNFNGDMEKIKNHIEFDFNYYPDHEKEEIKNRWEKIEKEAKIVKNEDDKFLNEWYKLVLEKYYYDGWEIRQPIDKPIGYYNYMKAYNCFFQIKKLNQGECDVIIRSGKFYPLKKKKYYVWKHDLEKGKDWSIEKELN